MAEVQQEKSRGSFDSGPTCLFGTATLAWDDPTSSVEIATGLAEVHAVVLNYAEAGGDTELYATWSGGVVTLACTGNEDTETVSYIIAGLL